MPKVNVYLPDDLAEAVKEAGVPVSAVCQRALEQAVRRLTAIRETPLADLDGEPAGALAHFTDKSRTVLELAVERARAAGAPRLSTEHLLGAMLDEGTNLALQVLRAMEIEPERVGRELTRRMPEAGTPEARTYEAGMPEARTPEARTPEVRAADVSDGDPRRFDGPAANALELTVTEATSLGHNYVGCEHLLLGLVGEPDGVAGQVLRSTGADPKLVRRAVTAALAGYVHLRAQSGQGGQGGQDEPAAAVAGVRQALAAAVRQELEPLGVRIARLEAHLGLASAPER
ncbi:Clp protease N-terminal domain-containing protein [Streptomyces sp. NPDC050610]|uniref:Clp protease N-terminal domain-containing protein n=1 Tax=Streptomyces sp. NPDC050610 TaxID=3157097 RepID=UPI00341B391D